MDYGFSDLARDVRKALSLPPSETMKRLSGRAFRYARRIRNRSKGRSLSDAELFSSLVEPVRSVEELGRRRQGSMPLLPASAGSAEAARYLGEVAPESREPILSAARRTAAGVFDLLGSGPVKVGVPPDWHLDFKSGRRWDPGAYSLEIVQVPDRGHDIKVPWELARMQHLPTLGIAAAVTGDGRFREAAVAQIRSFIAENPPYRGVNWTCTMDVALRAAELLVAEGYLRPAGTDAFWGELLRALLLHARFIVDNLEDGPVKGNHLIADLAGLYLCALGLPEFREAPEWRRLARERLSRELRRQVAADGLDYEASLSYHAFVTEMFFYPALIGSEKGDPFPADYLGRVETMIDALGVLMRMDGTLPQIGDNDDGRFLILSQFHRSRRDWRPLMALGAYFFRRSDWLTLSGEAWVEGTWVLGARFLGWRGEAAKAAAPPSARSRAFPQSGIYQLADGPVRMVVDAGPVGQGGNGGHAHNDTLAFDLHAFGEEILPDRGTGTYTPDSSLRNRFRSVTAHNTIGVDGEEINPFPEEAFRLIPADAPQVRRWRAGSRWVYLAAEHSGYRRLPEPVLHRRRILLDRARRIFRIQDRLEGKGSHRFETAFHLSPGWTVAEEPGGWTARSGRGPAGLRFRWVRPPARGRTWFEECSHSPSYGVFVEAHCVRTRWEAPVPCRVDYLIEPLAEVQG